MTNESTPPRGPSPVDPAETVPAGTHAGMTEAVPTAVGVSSRQRLRKGDRLELTITTLAFGGQGIGRLDNFVVFVNGAVPGDVAEVAITRVKRSFAEARLERLLTPSPDRRDARCPHFGTCGGCRWQSLDYDVQLQYKEQQVRDSLERLGDLSGFELRPIKGMSDPWRYRNKVEFSMAEAGGQLAVGFHPPGRWDTVLPLTECHLVPAETEAVRATVETWLRDVGAVPWDARALTGFARHLTVREAAVTGEILVSLVTSPGELPQKAELVRRLCSAHPRVVGILHAVNAGTAEIASGVPHTTLWGRSHLYEQLGDLRLKIGIDAFFQTNTHMAEVLYSTAAEAAGLVPTAGTGADTARPVVWDLYSGIGSIALYMARWARAVLGIEIVDSAVADARENAEANGIQTATFLQGDARVVLKEVLEGRRSLPEGLERPDVVVLDPPRGGLAKKVVARVAASGPARIVYVSCNPTTMAPDCALFAGLGYRLVHVTPVDMFPHTPHIEAVGLLERINGA